MQSVKLYLAADSFHSAFISYISVYYLDIYLHITINNIISRSICIWYSRHLISDRNISLKVSAVLFSWHSIPHLETRLRSLLWRQHGPLLHRRGQETPDVGLSKLIKYQMIHTYYLHAGCEEVKIVTTSDLLICALSTAASVCWRSVSRSEVASSRSCTSA